jgi:hypothetical protein
MGADTACRRRGRDVVWSGPMSLESTVNAMSKDPTSATKAQMANLNVQNTRCMIPSVDSQNPSA